jgi:hypothetical protein
VRVDDGQTKVAVPADWATLGRQANPGDSPVLRAAVEELRHQLRRAADRADKAEGEVAELRTVVDQARAETRETQEALAREVHRAGRAERAAIDAQSAAMRAEVSASVADERLQQMETAETVRKARERAMGGLLAVLALACGVAWILGWW